MKCEQGDVAKIINATIKSNIGKTVLVSSYIGKFKQGEEFQFREIICRAPISDHYWWIESEYGLYNMLGKTPRAYIPDTWLEPLRPEGLTMETKEDVELDA